MFDPWILSFSAVTVLATLWMGYWAARKARTASDFFVAGRGVSVGWNASAISGEYLSAASFMGIAGMVMSSGYDALWYPVCYACGYLFLLLFIAGPLRRFGAYTIPDFAEGRYDSPIFRKIAVIFVLFIGFFYTMPQMKGAGTTLSYIFQDISWFGQKGLPYWVGVVLVGAVITFNVAIGGMKGITLVQAFQYWLKMFAISVPVFVLMSVYGGYGRQLQLQESEAVAPAGPLPAKVNALEDRPKNRRAQLSVSEAVFEYGQLTGRQILPPGGQWLYEADIKFHGWLSRLGLVPQLRLPAGDIQFEAPIVEPRETTDGHFAETASLTLSPLRVSRSVGTIGGPMKPIYGSSPFPEVQETAHQRVQRLWRALRDRDVLMQSEGEKYLRVVWRPEPEQSIKPTQSLPGNAGHSVVREVSTASTDRGTLQQSLPTGLPTDLSSPNLADELSVRPSFLDTGLTWTRNSRPVNDRTDRFKLPIIPSSNDKYLPWGQFQMRLGTRSPPINWWQKISGVARMKIQGTTLPTNGVPLDLVASVFYQQTLFSNPDIFTVYFSPGLDGSQITILPLFEPNSNPPKPRRATIPKILAANGYTLTWLNKDSVKVYPTALAHLYAQARPDSELLNVEEHAIDIKARLYAQARPDLELNRTFRGRESLPAKAPGDASWLNPFGPLTTKAAKAAKLEGDAVKPYALLYTYSLIIALVCGTAGLPHILVRFYTNPDGVAAKRTTMWVMILIGVFYVFPPVFGVMGRNLMPALYEGTGAKGTDKVVLELPKVLDSHTPRPQDSGRVSERESGGSVPWGSILSGITCAGAFAAFMSTFSGLLVSMTGALAHDVYGRMLRPKSTAADRMRMFKWCAVLIGGIAMLLGCFVEPLEINFMVGQAFAIAAASYFPLLFMSVWWRGMTIRGAATGMLAGGSCALMAVALTNASNLALDKGPMGKLFSAFAPLNGYWAAHPLLRILCEQPAIWTVPLAIGLMYIVSKFSAATVPSDIRMKMLVLHAPEKLGLKQDYIRDQEGIGH